MLAQHHYEPRQLEKGYSNRTLYVNVGTGEILEKPVSDEMKAVFTGGKGFNLRLLWNSLPKGKAVKWDDPENEICIACGPLGGNTMYPGAGKSIALTICPLTGSIIDSNVGGYFGPYLKFSGWDALEIQGKADEDVVVVIDGDASCITIEKADHDLPAATHLLAERLHRHYGGDKPRSVSVVSAGPGAENTLLGCLNFSYYDTARGQIRFKQAGRGGTGTVLRDKKIAAIVAKKTYTAPRWHINA
jgi:aldehyde:ferredoxin oxidoreductase